MRVSIIKYNAGNILSVYNALLRLGVEAVITDSHDVIMSSDKIIFPGVGEAGTTMKYLRQNKLDELIKNLSQPLLGICLGLQLMCSHSDEGDTQCLGIFPQKVKRFDGNLKVPHIGWNTFDITKGKLFDNSFYGKYVYFVHSYYAELGEYTSAITDYGIEFSAALEKDNYFATQFHPEKSGTAGQLILKKFLDL